MQKDHFHKHLDQLTEWTVATDILVCKTEKKGTKNQYHPPEKGYTVVLKHKPLEYPCEWCGDTCSQEKLYRRSSGSNVWAAKCQDCGQKRNFHTSEINTNK